ncbi:transposase [Kitasatospora sp. NPDC052896]|uniref:transposase n=1 Tax=Kitasatospora sp. NPDC052896 TaxID=3364061 RepID=UPI0037CC1C6B
MLDARDTWILMVQVDRSPAQMVMKHYPPRFKVDAVALYRSRPGATIKSVAEDLGVSTGTPRNWIRAADGRRPVSHSAAGSLAPAPDGDTVQAELAAARKRIRELEEERDILQEDLAAVGQHQARGKPRRVPAAGRRVPHHTGVQAGFYIRPDHRRHRVPTRAHGSRVHVASLGSARPPDD